jgi:hypothetical protein
VTVKSDRGFSKPIMPRIIDNGDGTETWHLPMAPIKQSRISPGPDDPLRLADAVGIAFPEGSGITVATLRNEARKGNLTIETIGNKQFTTLRHIERMRELCRADQKGQDSTSSQQSTTKTARSVAKATSSSVTERSSSALAALRQIDVVPKKHLPTTSPANTESAVPATVIRLKS